MQADAAHGATAPPVAAITVCSTGTPRDCASRLYTRRERVLSAPQTLLYYLLAHRLARSHSSSRACRWRAS